MASAEDIKKLLDGRKIIDEYRAAKFDRSSKDWVHPSIPEMVAALEKLEFKGIDDFFLFDMKLSYQEIADVIDMVSTSDDAVKVPMCDNCAGRLPAGCNEVMRVIHGSSVACKDTRAQMDVATSKAFYDTFQAAKVLTTDPVLTAYTAEATRQEVVKCNLCTLDDVILFWNYPGHFAPRCTMTIKMKREFDFDPFWQLGERCFPVVTIPPLEEAREG